MIRLVAVVLSVVLFAVPLLMAQDKPVVVIGLMGLFFTALGLLVPWRWPVTGAACMFLAEYALALWLADRPGAIIGAVAFGFAILLLLQSADLAVRARHAAVGATVVGAQLARWGALGAGGLAAVMVALVLAAALAPMLPPAASPFLAAAGALGIVLTLATTVVNAARNAARGPNSPRQSPAAEQ